MNKKLGSPRIFSYICRQNSDMVALHNSGWRYGWRRWQSHHYLVRHDMGERSGGGACCVQDMQTADGQNYRISTYRDRSTDKNFVNNDTGITPTEGYAFDYANFYNLDFLSNKINKQ